MWHGVGGYLVATAIVAMVVHRLIRRFAVACLVGATLCSVLNLFLEAWLAGCNVNPGWALPMFIAGTILALPVCAAAGWLSVIFGE